MLHDDNPASRLRRLADAAPALGEDGAWLADRLRAYLDARGAMTLDAALGVTMKRGGAPWWKIDRLARRDGALRELAILLPAASIAELAAMLSRYETTRWRRDCALIAAPDDYAGTPRGAMFEAFRAGDGRVPTSEKQLRRILLKGHEMPSCDVPEDARICEQTEKERAA